MSSSLPHLQKLHEEYAGDDRVAIVAVATAFEKEHYPFMADEEQIKGRLEHEGWEFPVMRDKDEKTVRILGFRGSYGTPTTLVIDTEGIVRWHDFNGNDRTAGQVAETVEELLESFYVAPIEDLDPKLRAYERGKYGEAYKAAQKILEDEEADPELRAQAETVCTNLNAGVERLVATGQAKRSAGYPSAAKERLESAVKMFKGVPGVSVAQDALKALRSDRAFKTELKAEKDLEKVLEEMAEPGFNRSRIIKKLEKLGEKYGSTPVAQRISAALYIAR